MPDMLNLKNISPNEPITIHNRLYVLGNPIVSAQTLEQLVYALDQVGDTAPIVIVNPEATTIPNFSERVRELIQNNRRSQPVNNTSTDRYTFCNLSDAQLQHLAEVDCKMHSTWNLDIQVKLYHGLRDRARALYEVDALAQERDQLWAAHCANPNSPTGSERYSQIVYQLLPQAQARYSQIVQYLEDLSKQQESGINSTEMQQSSVPEVNNVTQQETASTQLSNDSAEDKSDEPLSTPGYIDSDRKPWITWLQPDYFVMPLEFAERLVKSEYQTLVQQQQDVIVQGQRWEAVQPKYLIALGIPIIYDNVPVCYTKQGTFRRIGQSTVPPTNVRYWYPTPQKGLSI